MSGGFFDYNQFRITQIADDIEYKLKKDNGYSDSTNQILAQAVKQIRIAGVYANRIDYLFSGDDTEEYFQEKLLEEMKHITVNLDRGENDNSN
jgi:hypothetical protein